MLGILVDMNGETTELEQFLDKKKISCEIHVIKGLLIWSLVGGILMQDFKHNFLDNIRDKSVGGGYSTLTFSDLAQILGTSEEIVEQCLRIADVSLNDLSYRVLVGEEKDREILAAIKRIENDTQVVATAGRTQVWQNGWNENLQEFIASNYDLKSLYPKYFRKGVPLRLNQQFIKSENQNLESVLWNILRVWLFITYFSSVKTIYEFGCGTGQNLVSLAKLYPNKKLFGLDFVSSSVNLINLIHEKHGLNIQGQLFDMIHPDYNFTLKSESAVFTAFSIEQTGNQYEDFINYILRNNVALCVHIEPLAEVYDQENLIDYLAYKFHSKRNYPNGLIKLLKELESDGRIVIDKIRRYYFGNLNHEGYNVIVWRPIKEATK